MNNNYNWRYATQKFDPLKKIPKREFDELLEVLRFSPSSFGLQPWKFILVHDPVLKKKLRPHACDQSQVTDADTLIVLCVRRNMDEKHVTQYIDRIAKVRGVPKASLSGYERTMINFFKTKPPAEISQWMKNQVYIALGVLLAECAHRKIDACPMEGFDPKKFDETLQLHKQNLESVVLCAVGYRAQDDHYANLKKVRFEKSEVFVEK